LFNDFGPSSASKVLGILHLLSYYLYLQHTGHLAVGEFVRQYYSAGFIYNWILVYHKITTSSYNRFSIYLCNHFLYILPQDSFHSLCIAIFNFLLFKFIFMSVYFTFDFNNTLKLIFSYLYKL